MTMPVPWSIDIAWPIRAPGWMSMPVSRCATSVTSRGSSSTPMRVQLVRHPVAGEREEPGVGQDHLVHAPRGRVGVVGGLRVLEERVVDRGKATAELAGHALGMVRAGGMRGEEPADPLQGPTIVVDGLLGGASPPRRVMREEKGHHVVDEVVSERLGAPGKAVLAAGDLEPPEEIGGSWVGHRATRCWGPWSGRDGMD